MPVALSDTIRDEVKSLCESHSFRSHVFSSFDRGKKDIIAIKKIFQENNLPSILAYLPIVESGFREDAKNASGAVGAWQFMKGTALDMNLKVSGGVDERNDLMKSSQAAAKYFSVLKKMFDGDLNLMLAGYNAGPNYLKRNMKKQDEDRFSKLSLYKETSNYIPKFWATILILKDRDGCKL